MTILGLSFGFHDASVAACGKSGLLFAAAEERFSLQKHDSAFPALAIAAARVGADMQGHDFDAVAYYERPALKFVRVLGESFSRYPAGSTQFARAMRRWLGSELWVRNAIAERMKISPRRVHCLPHHQCHAAQAFSTSGFASAAILIVDGVGELSSTTLAVASSDTASLRILEDYEYPNSIGLVYSAFTVYLGFPPNSGECSTMALAAFGQPRYVDEIRRILEPYPDGSYEVDPSFFNFLAGPGKLFSGQLEAALGAPRGVNRPYAFDALLDEQSGIPQEDQRFADIAASLQRVVEEVLLGLARRLLRLSGERDLCVAGGVAFNCLANSRIVEESGFLRVHIPVDPGDGGASVGAASLVAGGMRSDMGTGPFLGAPIGVEEIRGLLDPAFLMERTGRSARIEIEELADDRVLARRVAEEVAGGRIVALVRGRFEYGPRALGNRSLLVDPSNLAAVRRLSTQVKAHAGFRPYALSMNEEAAARLLRPGDAARSLERWMQSVWPVAGEYRHLVRGGVHADGTTRPQVCRAEDNPFLHEVLEEFGRAKGGLGAILNTSFNERGMPIVNTAASALATWMRCPIDTLVLGNFVLTRQV